MKSSLGLADAKSNRSKRRRLGIVKADKDLDHTRTVKGNQRSRGSSRDGVRSDDSPLFKGAMLKEIGEVMDIVKTIQVRLYVDLMLLGC